MIKPGYIKSLDGIRALAVALVIFHHWPFSFFNIPFGWVGVQLFFVMSGFLITRILLNEKELVFSKYLKRFYLKRALRIFPLYFGFLTIASLLFIFSATVLADKSYSGKIIAVLRELPVNSVFIYTYTYNFAEIYHKLVSHVKIPDTQIFSHLWSLSVEEQFYLLFPFVIYFLSEKNLKRFLIFILIACPVARLICTEWFQSFSANNYFIGTIIYRQTPFQFDALCLGASLAVFDFKKIVARPKIAFYFFLSITVIIGICNYMVLHNSITHVSLRGLGFEYPENMVYGNRLSYGLTLINICCGLLILCSTSGKPITKYFETKILIFIGKISYGIYLFHYPLLRIYHIMLSHIFSENQINNNTGVEFLIFAVYLLVVLLLSATSFYFFESRFLKMKEKISDKPALESDAAIPKFTY